MNKDKLSKEDLEIWIYGRIESLKSLIKEGIVEGLDEHSTYDELEERAYRDLEDFDMDEIKEELGWLKGE